jgi:hypothetical protein
MPGRNYSRQFKLDCARKIATGQKRPLNSAANTVLPRASCCAEEKSTMQG